jgi:hypothetical protein
MQHGCRAGRLPCAGGTAGAPGARRGEPCERAAGVLYRGPARHGGEGKQGAGARGTAELPLRISRGPDHRESRARGPSEGGRPLRSADRARHPARLRTDRAGRRGGTQRLRGARVLRRAGTHRGAEAGAGPAARGGPCAAARARAGGAARQCGRGLRRRSGAGARCRTPARGMCACQRRGAAPGLGAAASRRARGGARLTRRGAGPRRCARTAAPQACPRHRRGRRPQPATTVYFETPRHPESTLWSRLTHTCASQPPNS